MRDDVTCRTSNGDVTVRVGPDVAAAIRLETDRGEASVGNLPVTVTTDRRNYFEGSLRGGDDPRLHPESSNGDVSLRPLR